MLNMIRIRKCLQYIVTQNGHDDRATLRNIKKILDTSEKDKNNVSEIILESIIKGLLEDGKSIIDVVSNIRITNPINDELIEELYQSQSLQHDELVELRLFIENLSINSSIKSTVTEVQNVAYDILKGSIHDPYELKKVFRELTEKVFAVSSEIDKGLNNDSIEIHKENVDPVLDEIKKYLEVSKIIIPTTIQALDSAIFDRGLHSSRLYLFIMKSGGGKSTVLLSLAHMIQKSICKEDILYQQILKDKAMTVSNPKLCVYYFTFENSKDETLERYYPAITGIKMNTLEDFENNSDKLREAISQYDVALSIKYRGSFTTSHLDIIRVIEEDIARGYIPIAILADYIGIMIAADGTIERRLQLEKVTAGLKDVAVRFNCPVLSGAQIKKDSYQNTGSEITISDIKESSGIIDNADTIIGAWDSEKYDPKTGQGDANSSVKYMNFKSLKQRNYMSNVSATIKINFERFSLLNTDYEELNRLQNKPQEFQQADSGNHMTTNIIQNSNQNQNTTNYRNESVNRENSYNSYQSNNSTSSDKTIVRNQESPQSIELAGTLF